MNAELLLTHYERVAEAPDAIQRLRELVLDIAIQGKATNFKGPWRKTTLAELGAWGSGGTPSKSHPEYYGGDIPWLVIGDLNDGIVERSQNSITEAGLANSSAKLIAPGTVLIAMYGSIGKLGIAGIECATNQAIAYCVPAEGIVTRQYLFWLLRSLRKELLGRGQGIAQQNISQKILKAWPVQLPPLAEQHRIVAKVDELMALCDKLEAAQAEREAGRDKLTLSTLAKFNEPDPENFADDARFALEHLEPLTKRTDQIKQLRQTILNLAVRGKLAEQDPNDEPASEQLLRIGLAKSASQKMKQAIRDAKRTRTSDCADPVPFGWALSTLGELALSMRYGTSIKCEREMKGAAVLRIPNVSNGTIDLGDLKFGPLNEKEQAELALEAGDLLIIRSNGSLAIVGRSAVVTPEATGMSFAGYLVRVRLLRDEINPHYLWLSLNSSSTRDAIEVPIRSAVGLKNVNLTEFGALKVSVPPLAEQHRIVAKVDELMTLCDQLEDNLAECELIRSKLLEALLYEAFSPRMATGANVRL